MATSKTFKTKNVKAGFCNDRVHVVCRRHVKEGQPLDKIVYDLEWLARYVINRRLQVFAHEDTQQDIVQHMVTTAIQTAKNYPYKNLMGSKQPAFAYFNVVMYHAGLKFLENYRKHWRLGEQSPEERLPDKLVSDPEPPMFIAEKMAALIENSRKVWFKNDADDKKLRLMLEKTAEKCEVATYKGKNRVTRLYQAIVMLTLSPDTFPRGSDSDMDVYYRALALLIGENKAQQACFLQMMLEGEIKFKPG
jgi:hypothetical protein